MTVKIKKINRPVQKKRVKPISISKQIQSNIFVTQWCLGTKIEETSDYYTASHTASHYDDNEF